MALPPLAEVSELEIRLGLDVGSLVDADLLRAEAALSDASALVRAEGKPWLAADGITVTAPDVVVTVVVQAALRAYRNPDNYQGESVDGYAWQAAPGTVGAYLLDDEVSLVRRAARPPSTSAAASIRTPSGYADPDAVPSFWGL